MKKVIEGYFADRWWYNVLNRFLLFTHPAINRDKLLGALSVYLGKKISRKFFADLPPLPLALRAKSKQPLLSVVITCFNYGVYLPEALKSLKEQTFQNFEIIIVNDGSDDPQTLRLLAELKKDPQLKIIDQPHTGPATAKNSGIERAGGKYACSLDADDLLESSYLEKTLRILEAHPQYALVYSWMKCFGAKTQVWTKEDLILDKIIHYNQVSPGAVFRMSAWQEVGGYKVQMNAGYDDWELWLSFAEKGFLGKVIPHVLYYHRVHLGSLSHRIVKAKKEKELYQKIKNLHADLFQDKSRMHPLQDRIYNH